MTACVIYEGVNWTVITMFVSEGKFDPVYQWIIVVKMESTDLKGSGFHSLLYGL